MSACCPRVTKELRTKLAEVSREIEGIRKVLAGATVVTPVLRAQVDNLLGRNDIQLVHFSGHGVWQKNVTADLSELKLDNGESVTALAFAASRLGAEAQPILYLNACFVGRGGATIGRPGGFASNCLEGGWSGLIAPLWPVYDPRACDFSLNLYRRLRAGRSVGEALQEIRAASPDDPTAQSYSYFGDPWARLIFD